MIDAEREVAAYRKMLALAIELNLDPEIDRQRELVREFEAHLDEMIDRAASVGLGPIDVEQFAARR